MAHYMGFIIVRKYKNPAKSGVMAFQTRDEDEYTRRVINCEWSFEVNQERIFYLLAKIVFSLHLTTVMFVIEVADRLC